MQSAVDRSFILSAIYVGISSHKERVIRFWVSVAKIPQLTTIHQQ